MKDGEDYESKKFSSNGYCCRLRKNTSTELFLREVLKIWSKQLSELVSQDKKLKQPKMETEAHFACIIIT